MIRKIFLIIVLMIGISPASLLADGAGTGVGAALLRNSGARSSGMGNAFTAVSDDVTAMDFNPAVLSTLKMGDVSLQYEKGFFDDNFSRALVGIPFGESSGFGVSVGAYDSGEANLFDGINAQRTVTAEKDLLASAGYGLTWRKASLGIQARYLRSELAETFSDSAMTAGVGLQVPLTQKIRMGASAPLWSAKLQFAQAEEELPEIYRLGFAWITELGLATGNLPLLLTFDVPYDATEAEAAAAVGAETRVGALTLRAGYNNRSDLQRFSMGAGFQLLKMNINYAFGLVEESAFDSIHKVTLSLRFNRPSFEESRPALTRKKQEKTDPNRVVFEVIQDEDAPFGRIGNLEPSTGKATYTFYKMRPGETLQSIAEDRLGSSDRWGEIFSLNSQLYESPDDIKAGSQILVPER